LPCDFAMTRCRFCPEEVREGAPMLFHIYSKHPDALPEAEIVVCEECKLGYRHQDSLHRHNRVAHPDKPAGSEPSVSCGACTTKLTGTDAFLRHLYEDHAITKWKDKKILLCTDCSAAYVSDRMLWAHKA